MCHYMSRHGTLVGNIRCPAGPPYFVFYMAGFGAGRSTRAELMRPLAIQMNQISPFKAAQETWQLVAKHRANYMLAWQRVTIIS